MDTAHRKIELQAPADLTYLIANTTQAARAKIDLHFPPSAAPESGDDAMKARVEELVDQYINATFALTHPSLSINGLSGAPMEQLLLDAHANAHEQLEPFDAKLNTRILTVSAEIERLTLQVANMRREVPARAARAWEQRTREQEAAFEAERKEAEERGAEELRVQGVRTGAEGVERWADMQRSWEGGLRSMGKVKEGVGATTARVERARRAVEYLDEQVGVVQQQQQQQQQQQKSAGTGR